MQRHLSLLFFALCFVSSGWVKEAQAQDWLSPDKVSSTYGKFKVTYNKDNTCKVSFSSTIGEQKNSTLFTTECLSAYDFPGISSPGVEAKMGSVEFPFLASNGDEFHLFSIAAALGGSACYGTLYWVVVINGAKVWATKDSFSDCMDTVTSAKAKNKVRKSMISFLSEAGVSYNVSMGRLETVIPKKKVKSTTTLSITGYLFPGGFGYSRYVPTIQSTEHTNDTLIDEVGQCALSEYEDDTLVQMTAELKVWSDGVEKLTCISVQKK